MAQSIVCGGCGTDVPYGRLSCPECGEMLASVAGAVRRPSPMVAAAWPEPDTMTAVAAPVDPAPPVPSGPPMPHDAGLDTGPWTDVDDDAPLAGQLVTWPEAGADEATDTGPDLGFDDEPLGTLEAPGPAVAPAPVPPALDAPAANAPANDAYAAALAAVRGAPVDPPPMVAPDVGLTFDDPEPASEPALEPEPAPMSTPAAVTPPVFSPRPVATAAVAMAATPGAYVPPVLQPAAAPAPARAWAGHAAAAPDLPAATGAAGVAVAETEASAADAQQAKAVEFVGWLAIAGSALALVGFLLPWSSIAVIGADGIGYFDRWGLAGPWHLLIVAGLVAVLVAAILRDRVPIWLGVGLPGVGLGALLLGVLWPYLLGPLGGALGAMAVALGGLMLVGAGIAAIVVDRHGRDIQGV